MLRVGSARRYRALATVGALLVVAALFLVPSTAGADATRPTVERVHARGRYPSDLLVNPPPDSTRGGHGGGSGRRPLPVFGGRGAPDFAPEPPSSWNLPRFDFSFLGSLWWLGYLVLGVGLAGLVALLVYLLFRLRSLPPDEPSTGQATSPDEGEAAVDPLLLLPTLSHAELAALGRYREAVHALLVEALLSTGWAPEGRLRGLTAREIVLRYEGTAPPREPLVDLLRLVERVWFGAREATRETYENGLVLHARFVPARSARTTAAEVPS